MKTTRRRASKTRPVRLNSQLELLEHAQLVRRDDDDEPAYSFKHTLTRETAYDSLLLRQRREIHRAVGAAYEDIYRDRLDELAPVLADHYFRAGDDAKTLDYATRAGDAAVRVYANREAIDLYSKALEAAGRIATESEKRIHLFRQRGRAYELANEYERAQDNYREMQRWAQAENNRPAELEALILLATVYAVQGHLSDPVRAQELSLQALDLARELKDRPSEARIDWNLLLINRFGNEGPQRAIEFGERSIALAREMGLTEQLALSLTDIVNAYEGTGRFDRALTVGDEAQRLWRQFDNRPMLAQSLAVGSYSHLVVADLDRALQLAQEAYAVHTAIGSTYGLTISATFLSFVHREFGRIDRYLELTEQAIRCGQTTGLVRLGLFNRVARAWTVASMGDVALGLDQAQEALERADAHDPTIRIWPLAVLVRMHLLRGRVDEAASLVEGVPLESFESNLPRLVVTAFFEDIAVAYGELAIAQGDFARSVTLANDLLASLQRAGARMQIPDVMALKAKGLEGQGQVELALALLRDASRLAETMQARMRLWPILLTLSEFESRHGHAAQAQATRAQARQVMEQIAAQSPAGMRQAFLAQMQQLNEIHVRPATDRA